MGDRGASSEVEIRKGSRAGEETQVEIPRRGRIGTKARESSVLIFKI